MGPRDVYGEELALIWAVASAPVDNRANEDLEESVAAFFERPRGSVAVVRGQTSRSKVVRIVGLTKEEAEERIRKAGLPS